MNADDFLDAPSADDFLGDDAPAPVNVKAKRQPIGRGNAYRPAPRAESVLLQPENAQGFADAPDPRKNAQALFNALTNNPELAKSPMYQAGAAVLADPTGTDNPVRQTLNRQELAIQRRRAKERAILAARENTDAAYGDSPVAQAIAAPGRRLLSGAAQVVGGVASIPQLFGSDVGRETAEAAEIMARANMPEDPGIADEVLAAGGQILPMVGGATAARAILAPILGEAAATGVATTLSGAAGGAMTGGEVLRDLRDRADVSPEEAQRRALAATVFSALTSKYADRFLIPGADKAATGPLNAGARAFAAEGAQESLDQMGQNVATDRPVGEGALRAGLIGGITGGATRVASDVSGAPFQLAQAIEADALALANQPTPPAAWAPVEARVAQPLPAPVPPPAPAAPPPAALPYDPNVAAGPDIMVSGRDGTVRPMTSAEFLDAEETRQEAIDTGLTPDVRRAQQNRSDVTDVEPKVPGDPLLLQRLIAAGWTPPKDSNAVSRETSAAPAAADPDAAPGRPGAEADAARAAAGVADGNRAGQPDPALRPEAAPELVLADMERLYQQDVKDSIRERLGLARPVEQAEQKNTGFLRFLREFGVSSDLAADVYGDNAGKANRAMPGVFRRNGLQLDDLVVRAVERGFLTQADVESALDNGGTNRLVELIQNQIRGKAPVSTELAQETAELEGARRARAELEDQASAIGFDITGMSEPQIAAALKRIERRVERARTERREIDRMEEARLEWLAMQDERLFTDEDLAALDAEWFSDDNLTWADAMMALGTDPAEINNGATEQDQGRGRQAADGDAARAAPRAGAADEGGAGRPAGDLESYSPDEVVARQDRAAAAERDEQRRQQEADRRAQADAQRGEFTLTGSDRAADANPDQDALFSKAPDSDALARIAENLRRFPTTDPKGMPLGEFAKWARERRLSREALADELQDQADGLLVPVRGGMSWGISRDTRPDGIGWRITRFDAYMTPLGHQVYDTPRAAVLDAITQADPSRLAEEQQFRGPAPEPVTSTSTAASMRAELRARFGDLAERLERRGILKLWDSIDAYNEAGQPSQLPDDARGVQGMYSRGVAHLFGDGVEPGNAVAVFLHEVGEHASMKAMLGDRYKDLVRRAYQLVSEGDEIAETAMMRIPDDTPQKFYDSELLAYMIEETAGREQQASPAARSWLRDVIAAIRAWFYQTGFAKKLEAYGVRVDLTPKDIAALAVRAAQWQAKQGRTDATPGKRLAVAYHGTPHNVERFSADKIGTGEGNQAYGWGLYFAESHGVADSYRKTLSETQYFVGGQPINNENPLHVAAATLTEFGGDRDTAASILRSEAATSYSADMANIWRESAKILESGDAVPAVEKRQGALYQVDIPDAVAARMLLWDKPMSEQPESVRKAAQAEMQRIGGSANTGERLYRELVFQARSEGAEHPEKAASQRLDEIGIPGVKYLDGGSRNARPPYRGDSAYLHGAQSFKDSGASVAETRAGMRDAYKQADHKELDAAVNEVFDIQPPKTHNFVVFNDRNVKITHKDGSPVTQAEREEALEEAQFSKRQPFSATGSNPAAGQLFGPQPWTVAEPGTWDNVVRTIQNNKVDLKRVRDAIEQRFGRIADKKDAYLQEELYHGKVSARIEKLHADSIEPILRKIAVAGKNAGVTLADVNLYLHARHAPERNAAMAAINPTMPNNRALSGMSDQDAARVMADFGRAGKMPALQAIAKDVDQLLADTRTNLVADGLEEAGTIQAWEQAYQHYVPLMRDIEDRPAKGSGISVRGPEAKRAVGSNRQVVDILANIVTQAETAAIRAEKAEVGRALLAMAKQYPNADFWTVDTPPAKPRINPNTGLVERNAVDPLYQTADNVVMVKDYGATRFIVFNKNNERAMEVARAMKNLEVQQLPRALRYVGAATRFMASLLTQRNPEFWLTNLARDLQAVGIQLNGTDAEGLQGKVFRYLPKAMGGMRHVARGTGANTQWARYAQELKDAGGTTGYMQVFDNSTERMENLQREVDRMNQGKADPRRLARSILEFVDDYNDVIENGVRLAVFQAAREAGVSTDRAASLAKNITVNFNRKGNASPWVNSLYMFFNAGIQGTARLSQALATSNKARAVVGGLAGAAFVMDIVNRALAGEDDETKRNRYDLINEFEKSRNWIVMGPDGKYVKVPLPLGFHIFHNAGRLLADGLNRKDPRNAAEYGWAFASVVLDAFNPLGNVASVGQLLAPSVLDPAVQLAENKNFMGGKVYKSADAGFGKTDPRPAYQRYFETTPDFWKGASKTLNDISGGDKVKPGAIDIEPDILRHVWGAITGGPGRALDKTVDTAQATARGEEITPARYPFAHRFLGSVNDRQRDAAYFEDLKRAAKAKDLYDYYVKNGRRDLALEALRELGDGNVARGRQVIAEFDRAKKDERLINRKLRQLQEAEGDDTALTEQAQALKARRSQIRRRVLSNTAGPEEDREE